MGAYLATFDRIGRHHDVAPLEVAGDFDEIAEQIYRHARKKLASREVDVEVTSDPDGSKLGGHILVGGFRTAGTFTLTEVTQ